MALIFIFMDWNSESGEMRFHHKEVWAVGWFLLDHVELLYLISVHTYGYQRLLCLLVMMPMCVIVAMLQIFRVGAVTMMILDPYFRAVCIEFLFPDRQPVFDIIDDVSCS